MAIIDLHEITLDIRGTVGTGTEKKVYQKVRGGLGNISNGGRFDRQLRAHVIPIDPKTPAQIAQRTRIAHAVAAWHTLTAEDKINARKRASQYAISGFNQFVKEHIKAARGI